MGPHSLVLRIVGLGFLMLACAVYPNEGVVMELGSPNHCGGRHSFCARCFFVQGRPLTSPPPQKRNTFGPTEGQNQQWREVNGAAKGKQSDTKALCPPPPPPSHNPLHSCLQASHGAPLTAPSSPAAVPRPRRTLQWAVPTGLSEPAPTPLTSSEPLLHPSTMPHRPRVAVVTHADVAPGHHGALPPPPVLLPFAGDGGAPPFRKKVTYVQPRGREVLPGQPAPPRQLFPGRTGPQGSHRAETPIPTTGVVPPPAVPTAVSSCAPHAQVHTSAPLYSHPCLGTWNVF